MKDPLKLKELLVKELDMARVMLDYKVKFMLNPMKVSEAQFKCPFHGKDNKPSARFYRDTQSCWCWVCQKKWDLISFIMDKEQLGFTKAILFLIEKYRIDTSSIPDGLDVKDLEAPPPTKEVSEREVYRLFLRNNIAERRGKIPFEKYLMLCAVYYMVLCEKSESRAVEAAKKLEAKLITLG